MLKAEQLTIKKSNKEILQQITLEIPLSRITLLLGKSGSGKSTLLRCVAQLETPLSGTLSYQGTTLCTHTVEQRARLLGFVAQSYPLFPHMTALDNCTQPLCIAYGLEKHRARTLAKEMLDRFSLGPYCANFPCSLSGGQQQRVALARALVLDPVFLLFDEPTSALDPENTGLFVEIIQERCQQGKGIVIATQDMAFATKVLDLAYFLEEGKCCEKIDTRNNVLESQSKLKEFLCL